MPRIIISGSNGFIGSNLSKTFKAQPIPRHLLYSPEQLTDFIKGTDLIIHCAAFGNHSWQTDETEIFKANVIATYNLLQCARVAGVKNFINIGSSSEYGEKCLPMHEEMLPETKTMYGATKVAGTYLTRHYSNYFNAVTVRPFAVYGEDEDDRRFIPTVIRCLNTGETLNLMEGNRDWVHVDDFCKAVKLVSTKMELLNGLVLNVGTGESFSNLEIVDMLTLISGKTVDVKLAPARKTDSLVWVADSGKIRSLGWKPKVCMNDGLKRVYDFKTNRNADRAIIIKRTFIIT